MQLIRGLGNWPDAIDTAITIGNFDGAHLGHQAMFDEVVRTARERQLASTVISFDPLPHEYFVAQAAPARLQGLRDRYNSIKAAGIERLLLLDFDHEFAAQSADDFVNEVLIDTLHARHLVIGDDFRFGHRRLGNFELLEAASKTHEFTLQQSPTCISGNQRVSSTLIRDHLRNGALSEAATLLGRPYRISGRVVHGDKVGRQLGFPTANVALGRHRPALRGVFAAWAHDEDTGRRHAAVANLGERPTVGGHKLLLEVHLLDAEEQLYGHHLAIDFLEALRHEQRFASLDELKAQIARDADAARELMSRR
ncbi:bifunctional riboflavin kinase/FAD synthetase [Granulosicoccus sp. 3-233]|uniref:bifunctional riboflavin kinase/FAD synthetase n=1 Tax=Granulosicoccus sp. 3-233 TaxID=3417969 RepID=UPI003D33B28D